jgi:prophage regulatory protein
MAPKKSNKRQLQRPRARRPLEAIPAGTAKLLRRRTVEAVTSLPRSTLYEMIAKGKFPKPVELSAGRVAWVAAEVDQWVEARIAARALVA